MPHLYVFLIYIHVIELVIFQLFHVPMRTGHTKHMYMHVHVDSAYAKLSHVDALTVNIHDYDAF